MGFDHPILADHAWGSQSGRQQTVKQSVFFSILVSSVAQEPQTLFPVSLSVLLFREGKRPKEPSCLRINVYF